MCSCVRVSQIVLFIGRPYGNVERIKFYVNVVAKDEDSHKALQLMPCQCNGGAVVEGLHRRNTHKRCPSGN